MSLFLRRKHQRYIGKSFGIPKFGEGRNTISICNKILGKLFQGMNEEKMRINTILNLGTIFGVSSKKGFNSRV